MMKLMTPQKGLQRGFTLVEMAVVLIIVSLILGGLLLPLSAQIDQRNFSQTQQSFSEIKESLLGFAVSNKRLPCPDTDGDGLENPPAPTVVANTQTYLCGGLEGWLPSQTLGVGRMDSWSNRYKYRVSPAFSNRTLIWSGPGATGTVISDTYFSLSSIGNITVRTRGDNPSTGSSTESKFPLDLVTNAAAVIISHGKNGYGATSYTGTPMAAVPASNVDETTNATFGTTKISRLIAARASSCSDTVEGSSFCEFDDVVDWLPTTLIVNRMVTTGQLP